MSAKITAALHAVMADVPYVQKTGKNAFHGYRYAGEADLLEKLRPALLKHGLLLIPSAQEVSPADTYGNVNVRVEYTLAHKDGDVWPEKIGAVGCGNDRSKDGRVGDKGVYKALTGANKYLLFKLFQIETGDDPETADSYSVPDTRPIAGNQGPISAMADSTPISNEQCEALENLRKKAKVPLERFQLLMNVKAVADIPVSQFQRAKNSLDKKIRENEEVARAKPSDNGRTARHVG